MDWRSNLQAQYPAAESFREADDAQARHTGTRADIKEAYEAQMNAQMVFENTLTDFLGHSGRIIYSSPNFDAPEFSTGWMALEEPEIDEHGDTRPVPAIQVVTRENNLIWKYLKNQTEHPGIRRRLRPQSPEEVQQERAKHIRETLTNGPHAYIDIETALVTHAGTREPVTYAGDQGDIRGAYIPGVVLATQELPILPSYVPPNYQHPWERQEATHFMRIGAPKERAIQLPVYSAVTGGNDFLAQLFVDGYFFTSMDHRNSSDNPQSVHQAVRFVNLIGRVALFPARALYSHVQRAGIPNVQPPICSVLRRFKRIRIAAKFLRLDVVIPALQAHLQRALWNIERKAAHSNTAFG